jgi:hypothetical protein
MSRNIDPTNSNNPNFARRQVAALVAGALLVAGGAKVGSDIEHARNLYHQVHGTQELSPDQLTSYQVQPGDRNLSDVAARFANPDSDDYKNLKVSLAGQEKSQHPDGQGVVHEGDDLLVPNDLIQNPAMVQPGPQHVAIEHAVK